jgi:hypothetical protein
VSATPTTKATRVERRTGVRRRAGNPRRRGPQVSTRPPATAPPKKPEARVSHTGPRRPRPRYWPASRQDGTHRAPRCVADCGKCDGLPLNRRGAHTPTWLARR